MLPEERNPLEITFRAEPHPVIVFANDDKIKEQSFPSWWKELMIPLKSC